MSQIPPQRPVIGVGAIVWRGDQVLLVRRGRPPRKDEWSLPGGRQEWGETVSEAARREVREETGVEIDVRDVVAVVDLIDRDEADDSIRFHYTLVDVLAEWRAGEAHAGDDAAEVAWVDVDDLSRYRLWSETERIIRRAAELREARQHDS